MRTAKHMHIHSSLICMAHIHTYAHSFSHIDTARITQAGTHLYVHGSRQKASLTHRFGVRLLLRWQFVSLATDPGLGCVMMGWPKLTQN